MDFFYGHYLEKDMTCRNCQATWKRYEEKMTDVNIAVQLLLDAQKDLFDTALLISGDSDLYSPLEALRANYSNKRSVIAFPPRRVSVQLQKVAHGYFVIGRAQLAKSMLPDQVTKTGDIVLKRPGKWI